MLSAEHIVGAHQLRPFDVGAEAFAITVVAESELNL
jgi:hypothetical protein